MLWRDMRGRTKEIHKELQDLDPIGSPHLEEILIGGKIDLDLLSFPSKRCNNHGRNGRGRESFQIQQWRRENPNSCTAQGGRRGIYTPPPKI
jgi:hypothetical protein